MQMLNLPQGVVTSIEPFDAKNEQIKVLPIALLRLLVFAETTEAIAEAENTIGL
jgi:hypothetical protein